MRYTWHRYPPECFSINENVTRQRMAEYDRRQEAIDRRARELCPDWEHVTLRERYEFHRQAEKELFGC